MKPVLLLVPGMLNPPEVWARVIERVRETFEVRIADVRTQDSIEAMAADAWARVADLAPDRALHLAGFSMGGYVAIAMVARPSRALASLALISTSGRPESDEGKGVREKTIAAIGRDFDKVVAGVAQFGTDPARHADAVWMDTLRAMMRSVGPETAIRQNRAVASRGDHRDALARLALPVLVMCGRADRITPPELSLELADLIPASRLEWIEDAGHMVPLEQPERVAQGLLGQLR